VFINIGATVSQSQHLSPTIIRLKTTDRQTDRQTDRRSHPKAVSTWARSYCREKHLLASSSTSVRPSECVSATLNGRITVEFGTGYFYANVWRNFAFGENRAKISGTLRKELNSSYHCRRHQMAIKLLCCSEMASGC
jgi:hypothetical protein